MSESNKTMILKSLVGELSKTKIIVDVNGRATMIHQAASEAKNGAVCLTTEYIYADSTSTTIVATKEAEGVWDSTWDADFTI